MKQNVSCFNSTCKLKNKNCQKQQCVYHNVRSFKDNMNFCSRCMNSIFPFFCLDDFEIISLFKDSDSSFDKSKKDLLHELSKLNTQFENDNFCLNESIDPDRNFYDKIKIKNSLWL